MALPPKGALRRRLACGVVALCFALVPAFAVAQTVTPPVLRHSVEATYPPEALAEHREGSVLLELTVDATGHVTDAHVVDPAGYGFDEAAIEATHHFDFEPARAEGQSVGVRLRYRYRFRLPNAPLVPAVVTPPPLPPTTPPATDTATVVAPAVTPPPVAAGVDASAGEAVVHGNRPVREATLITLDREEIQRIPGTSGDAFRAIQNLPGLARAPTLTGLLIVRGSAPEDTQVFLDGVDIPLLYHFGGLTSVVSSDLLDRLDFFPGNFSARYGRAQGGIIDAAMRTPNQDHWTGDANLNLIDGSLRIEGPLAHNVSLVIAARRSWIDAVLDAALSNNPNIAVTAAPVYYDYQAILSWRVTSHDELRMFFFGSDDALRILFSQPSDSAPTGLAIGVHFDRLQFRWKHSEGERFTTELSITPGDTQTGATFGDFTTSVNSYTVSSRFDLSYRVSRLLRFDAGADLQSGPVSVQYTGPASILGASMGQQGANMRGDSGTVSLNTTIPVFRPALYTELEITPTPWLRLVPSLRFDYFGEIRQSTISPRAIFRVDVTHGWAVKGALGVFTQPPQFQESLGAIDTRNPTLPVGNPSLLPQRAVGWDLGIERAFSSIVSLSVEGFYKTFDLQVEQPTNVGFNINEPPYLNSGIGRAYGMEVLLRHRPNGRFFGWVSYTLSRSERQDAPGLPWHLFQYDQTHILTVVASVHLGRGWEAGLRFRYVSGNPYTARTGSTFNADDNSFTPVNGPTYGARLPAFQQLDLRIDKTWHFGRRTALDLYLDVQNVYNYANVEGISYSYDARQTAYTTGLPILPSLGARFDF